ncbi:MAG TPA: ureidoglycolate lyase [Acidimicrobiia bacterium]|jgi:ureidoglycolate hydrolase|nr:ureidoglycolate lyase [Acidimicrobiia bacterium]
MVTTTLRAEPIGAEAFAPFGWLPVADTDPADRDHWLHFEWADPNLNVITHSPDEVEHAPGGAPLCAVLYRHATHTQALMSLNVDAVVAVAPADVVFSSPDDLASVRAFRVAPLDAFVLHRGTWHWGPFPIGAEPVRLLNVQGLRYAEDNASVDLPARTGAVLEVVVPSATTAAIPGADAQAGRSAR